MSGSNGRTSSKVFIKGSTATAPNRLGWSAVHSLIPLDRYMIRKKRLARKDAGVGNWGPRGRNQQPRERVVEVKRKATSTIREEVRQVRSECGVRRRYARMWDVKCRY